MKINGKYMSSKKFSKTKNLEIHGDLTLKNYPYELPDGLKVHGDLYLEKTGVKHIVNLTVSGRLAIYQGTQVESIGTMVSVGDTLLFWSQYNLKTLPINCGCQKYDFVVCDLNNLKELKLQGREISFFSCHMDNLELIESYEKVVIRNPYSFYELPRIKTETLCLDSCPNIKIIGENLDVQGIIAMNCHFDYIHPNVHVEGDYSFIEISKVSSL